MKKYRLFLFLLIALFLTGCSANGYRYVDKGDKSYIVLDSASQNSSLTISSLAPYVYFSSISEMKEDIQKGNFSEEEKKQIAQFNRDKAGNIQTLSLDNLYEPIVASNYSIDYVSWTGKYYNVKFKDESTGETVAFSKISKERYDEEVQLKHHSNIWGLKLISADSISEPGSIIYTYIDLGGNLKKDINYIIKEDHKTLYVTEYYNYPSSSVPEGIVAYGTDNGLYFRASFSELTSRPSRESITVFGIKDYVETETS